MAKKPKSKLTLTMHEKHFPLIACRNIQAGSQFLHLDTINGQSKFKLLNSTSDIDADTLVGIHIDISDAIPLLHVDPELPQVVGSSVPPDLVKCSVIQHTATIDIPICKVAVVTTSEVSMYLEKVDRYSYRLTLSTPLLTLFGQSSFYIGVEDED